MNDDTSTFTGDVQRRDGSHALLTGLIGLAVFDGVILVAIMIAAGVSLLTALMILLPMLVAAPLAIGLAMRLAWPRWAREFPSVQPRDDAVSYVLQSFSFGGLRKFNNVLTIAVDEDHLHVFLPRALRWTGCRSMSIPWPQITDARRMGKDEWVSARVRGHRIAGPLWCMSLAMPADREADGASP